MTECEKLTGLVRPELKHLLGAPEETFLQSIDETGGWPVGYTHVSFYHDGPFGNRYCQFTTYPLNTGWWTTVCNADDYYRWKLSPKALEKIEKEVRRKILRSLEGMA